MNKVEFMKQAKRKAFKVAAIVFVVTFVVLYSLGIALSASSHYECADSFVGPLQEDVICN